ncbi:MAG: response regulator transcription factor [Oceanospirillaceae bacterium]|nr:response regulator transcription factor [Oceanospirillaceae bacterium]
MLRIVAADDHRIFLEGVNSLFSAINDCQLVAMCEHRDELLGLIQTHNPDVVLIDISMPGTSIESIIEAIDKDYPQVRVLALTMHSEPNLVNQLLSLGLAGYILKEDAFDELEIAVRSVACDEQYISNSLVEVMRNFHDNINTLSRRESEILRYISNGHSNKSVAKELDITERTVRFHLSNCCIKLDANGRTNAVAKALSLSIFEI